MVGSLLQLRCSTPSLQLREPGPSAKQLDALLKAAVHVPDHGKLTPWRFIRMEKNACRKFAARLLAIQLANGVAIDDAKLLKDQARYHNVPMILIVIARLNNDHKVPEIEQISSSACACFSILLAAHEMGLGAQWLTGWAAYNSEVAQLLRLSSNEKLIGFIHLGTPQVTVPDRERPDPITLTTVWADE